MSGLVRRAKKGFLDADIDLLADTIKLVLVRLASVTSSGVKVVTAATNATPIVCTSASHGWTNGDYVSLSGATGNTNVNGLRKIKNTATNTFELTDTLDVNIAGNGTFGGTCYAINLSVIDFLDDIDAGARIATVTVSAGRTTTAGVFDFTDVTFSAVSGSAAQCVFLYDDTPATEATKPLIAVDDQATNLPVTPNGGDINYVVNNTAPAGMFEV